MQIGKKLKMLRIKHNLTMQELADRTDLSKGFISQLENNQSSPSIDTLISILDVYEITLSSFFSENNSEKFVFYKNEISVLETDYYEVKWLIPNAQKLNLEPIIITLKAFAKSQVIDPFQGQIFGYVLKGTVLVNYGNEIKKLAMGESFYIRGNARHYLENPTNKNVEVIWISNPPIF